MNVLANHVGTWVGANGFRLMPQDPFEERAASATVRLAAGDHLATVSYRWEHPADGPQDGLLVVWSADATVATQAVWADSWHQQPEPMAMSGTAGDTTIELEGVYGDGWRWRFIVEAAGTDTLRMEMDNVIPPEHATEALAAGPYPVMIAELTRE